ncbi:MAG: MBL fold metallo-hydrolase [Sedimentisphaerales bacterium]|nr:MBL fold metallo-hydrolase [Sedimentisphaerales bacterium]
MSENKARELLWPKDQRILLRFVFLNVGQGSSTVVLVRSGDTWKAILVDINLDAANEGIDVPALMTDLLDGDDLEVFVNTHPHSDHLRGIKALSDKVTINQVWHSGHKPGKKHDDAYTDLCDVVKKVTDNGGKEIRLLGSHEEMSIFDARYYVLAPAKYVCDDVADEDQDARARRIHEQCAVLRFGVAESWGLLPGDADRDAFEKHITEYHEDRLNSIVLAAAHHGSRTFFRYEKEDEPYLDGLDAIAPEYVVISAKSQDADTSDPPHADAVELYQEKSGENCVVQTGEHGYSFITDIYDDGSYSGIRDDKGDIRDNYPLGKKKAVLAPPFIPRTRVDDRPMGE